MLTASNPQKLSSNSYFDLISADFSSLVPVITHYYSSSPTVNKKSEYGKMR